MKAKSIQVFSVDAETDKSWTVTVRTAHLGMKSVVLPKSQCAREEQGMFADIVFSVPTWLCNKLSI